MGDRTKYLWQYRRGCRQMPFDLEPQHEGAPGCESSPDRSEKIHHFEVGVGERKSSEPGAKNISDQQRWVMPRRESIKF